MAIQRKNYYSDLAADYSRLGRISQALGDQMIKLAEEFAAKQDPKQLPHYDVTDEQDRIKIETENKEWWPTHCEALRRGRGDLLASEYRQELVYFCQDGPFYGRSSGTGIEESWWKILSQPGVTMYWPIVMFHGEIVYFEWRCVDDITNETTAKGNVTFVRRGHVGGVYLKTEQLTFYRDVHASFFGKNVSQEESGASKLPLIDKQTASVVLNAETTTNKTTGSYRGKIGVLIEKHFDESEYFEFNRIFPENGYEVEYISHLWGQPEITFEGNDFKASCTVIKEISTVNLDDYVGFVLIGGYAMDRLRYEAAPKSGQTNQSPACLFLCRAMQANKIIGTICHSLWLFTAVPELIRDREVTCAHNILYDVQNSGAIVIFEDDPNKEAGTKSTHRDGNLVTGKHPGHVKEFLQLFLEALQN